jgi:hypothetical protein
MIAAAGDRLFPPAFQRELARDRLDRAVDVLPGGHVMALVHPGPLATHLLST